MGRKRHDVRDRRRRADHGAGRRAAARRKDPSITHVGLIHCETSTGILNPLPRDRRRRRAAWQEPHRRRDELVRRAADRRAHDAVRRAGRGLGQVRRRAAGHGLRVRAQGACWSDAPATRRRSRSTCTTSGRTWRRRRNGGSRRPRTSSSRSTRRSTSSSPKAGSRRGSRATRQLRDARRRAWRELGFRAFLDPRDPGADHRHVSRARRSEVHVQGVLRRVRDKGFILYPGKLTQVETFRVGCIGGRSVPTRCATRSTRCATRWPKWGLRRRQSRAVRRAAA